MHCTVEFGRVDVLVADLEELETMDRIGKSAQKDSMRKRWCFTKKKGEFIFPIADGRIKPLEEIRTWEHPSWSGIDQFKERVILDFLGESEGSLPPQDSFPDVDWSDKWFSVHVRKLQKPPSRWTKSQTLRQEMNHSLFNWNTMTSPELHIQIWMLSKSVASMIVGISMDQEICQILGLVSLSFTPLDWDTSKRIYVVRGETDKKAANIQARSFMARTLDEIGKKC